MHGSIPTPSIEGIGRYHINSEFAKQLSQEQHAQTGHLVVALTDKFSTNERPLCLWDFSVLPYARGLLVVFSNEIGLDRGSGQDVQGACQEDYCVELDRGLLLDARAGMNKDVHRALIKHVRAENRGKIPRGFLESYTLLSGEQTVGDGVLLAGALSTSFVASAEATEFAGQSIVTRLAIILPKLIKMN